MGLAEIVRGKQEKAVIEPRKVQKNEDTGDIKLDTADLDALGAQLKQVREALRPLKKDEERLKQLILSHPDAKAGYYNSHISITAIESLNLEDPDLLAALYKSKTLGEALNLSLSIPKVRKIAERVKAVGEVLQSHTGRKISTT